MKIIRTSRDNQERFARFEGKLEKTYHQHAHMILLDESVTYQEHLGFGGAFTESAAFTLSEMPKEVRAEALKKYFDPVEGLGYTLGRVHIHSCDFSLENYTYVEEGDQTLATFDMAREDRWVVPMIKDAAKLAGQPIKMLASPWSPPAYMKTNGEMNHGGQLKEDYKALWAEYYVKFIEHMEKRDIPIWALSVQNEPAAVQIWDSCIYSAEEERDFVKHHLGPTLEKSPYHDTKLIIWDHNRDVLIERADTVLRDPEAAKYVWGTGNHWYVSEDFGNLGILHELHPDKHLLFTEGCQEGGPHPGAWHTGERYGRNIIGDFNNWSEGWIDWNLVLNEEGGPNHVGNFCDAPILANRPEKDLIINSSYYYIGHFSKFIRPGAKRIKLTMALPEKVYGTAFKNLDGSIALVLQNEGDQDQQITIRKDELGASYQAPGHSITTFML